jgi:hypothetical protein
VWGGGTRALERARQAGDLFLCRGEEEAHPMWLITAAHIGGRELTVVGQRSGGGRRSTSRGGG